ncbi:MAG: alpha/beta fold hydrolase [Bryobacterales bacterium]|nr:alpha/beta hydrolase [Bryobacteraceae bacterium]MDW8131867.1 alpha/beta fold hydrolase [Bryobacterales bacterium]
MYVERYGSGLAAVLGLHGWSGDHRTFEPLVPYLPPMVTLYAPDLPGCGQSPPPGEWTLAGVLAPLADLARKLPAPLTLLGNCSGAILALCLALRLPESSLARLVLIDPFAYWPWYFRVFASRAIGAYAYWLSFGNPIGRRLLNLALAAKRNRQTDLTAGFRFASQRTALAYLRMLEEIRDLSEFARLRVPVQILHGERTFGAVRASLRSFQALWPAATVQEIAGAGHLPLKEAPQAVAASIFAELR